MPESETEIVRKAQPIAVIGMACRLPGGVSSPEDLWDLLRKGGDAVTKIPDERWADYRGRDPRTDAVLRHTTRWGGFLTDVAGFDADFFGISPREARAMDPQQRLLLEVAWEALERAGAAPGSLAGSGTGVFVGAWSGDYGRRLLEDVPGIEAWTGVGADLGSAAARLSYHLGLHGPSVTVDTACSSSLVAVHQACQSLRLGETDFALAAGVNLLLAPGLTVNFERAGALSRSGRCRAFDADADGYVRAEGCGVVVLKKLSDALADEDRVLGILRGSAVTQNGHGAGIMAPDNEAQTRTIRLACAAAGTEPAALDYIEAHGTGTPAGDAAEAMGIAAAVGPSRAEGDPCLVGSVKTNIGHAESAAGVAGLIKVLLALRHGLIPPSLHHTRPNQAVVAAGPALRIVTGAAAPWPRREGPRRAGVSSYGFGGTNAHLVVEEAPESAEGRDITAVATGRHVAAEAENRHVSAGSADRHVTAGSSGERRDGPLVFAWSGSSRAGRDLAAKRLADWLRRQDGRADLGAVAHTLTARRSHSTHRAAAVAESEDDILLSLDAATAGEAAVDLVEGHVLPGAATGPVWLFSGHGSQWTGMGRELLAAERTFAGVIEELEPVFLEETGSSLLEFLTVGSVDRAGADEIQPVIYAVQTALAEMWAAHGVRPAAVIGHSVGEIAAAVAGGGLSRLDGARLVCRRSTLLRRVAGKGAMALITLPADEVRRRLERERDLELAVAICASPESTVVAGMPADIEKAVDLWTREGLLVRRVASDVAFHSSHMDPLLADLASAVQDIEHRPPQLPMYSTSRDEPRGAHVLDASYWVGNLRHEVRLDAAVRAAAEDGHRVFVELSPHPVIVHSVRETLSGEGIEDACVVGTLRRAAPERRAFLKAAAALHCHGVPVDFGAGRGSGPWTDVPTTAWDHRHHWRDAPPVTRSAAGHAPGTGTLLGSPVPLGGHLAGRVWRTLLDPESVPGRPVRSGEGPVAGSAVLLATLAAAAAAGVTAGDAVTVREVELRDALPVAADREIQVLSADGRLSITSMPPDADEPDLTHATGRLGGPTAHRALADAVEDVLDDVLHEENPVRAVDGRPAPGPGDSGHPEHPEHPEQSFSWHVSAQRLTDAQLTADAEITQDDPETGPGSTWAAWIDAVVCLAARLLPNGMPNGLSEGMPDGPSGTLVDSVDELSILGTPPRRARIRLRRTPLDGDPTGGGLAQRDALSRVDATVDGPAGERLCMGGTVLVPAPDDGELRTHPAESVLSVQWEPLPELGGVPPEPRGAVAVVGPAGGPADQVEEGLRAAGARVLRVGSPDRLADPDVRKALTATDDAVLVPSGGTSGRGARSVDRTEHAVWETVSALRRLSQWPEGTSPRLWCAVGDWDGSGAEPIEHLALRGLSRVAAGEHPDLWGGLLHRDPRTPHDRACRDLLRLLARSGPREDVLRVSADGVLRPRLAPVAPTPSPGLRCGSDGTYLITGGLGALGLRFAEELVVLGARRLVLVGRRPVPPRSAWPDVTDPETRHRISRIRRLEQAGATVRTVALDIADEEQARSLLDTDAMGLPPVSGVVHAAGVIHGGMLRDLTRSSLRAELRSKAAGAMTLHRLHPPGTVDFFVLFSAVAAQLGLAGQGGYATANAFLDALAEHRRDAGCARSMSLAWPAWRGTGLAATAGSLEVEFEAVGVRDLTEREGMAAWRYARRCEPAHLVVLPLDRTRRPQRRLPLLERLFAEGTPDTDGTTDAPGSSYRGLLDDELRQRVLETVTAVAAAELGLAASALDRQRPLADLGMESIMALSIRRRLEREFGLTLPATLLWNHPTVQSLGARITGLLSPSAAPLDSQADPLRPAPASGTADPPPVDDFTALLDEFEAATAPTDRDAAHALGGEG